ncbi:disintegrin and metalloproteinase domain-containing protein 10-like isoform X2 [Tigriopus californicus]|uniref:disintegrin and metalloproteinase domain-containing protein 10-like isoform X2 n=1 Tax=Tigriopus californicus TaxID=6832 RepID=UPI0027D9DAD4|nr:disintegrin and metalloproteinase domain-containing protein 10-like isoform X2 [Tigriopus californicus]
MTNCGSLILFLLILCITFLSHQFVPKNEEDAILIGGMLNRDSKSAYSKNRVKVTKLDYSPNSLDIIDTNVDRNRKGILPEEGYQRERDFSNSLPKFCHEGVECQLVNGTLVTSTDVKFHSAFRRNASFRYSPRHKRYLEKERASCDNMIVIDAFGNNLTLCMQLRDFKDEAFLRHAWARLNISIFGTNNVSNDVSIDQLNLQFAIGYVLGETFSSISGFVINRNFYGTIYMKDAIHYLEPHGRQSRDMHILGNGLSTLLHKRRLDDPLNGLNRSRKRQNTSKSMTRRWCDLTLVADHLFFQEIGEESVENAIVQMLWHIREANALFQSKDFDNDGLSECIGFSVSEITLFTRAASPVNLLTGYFGMPEDFLKRFSRYNFEGFCLGVLFTNRAFEELVLGLSWRGNPKAEGVGGICQSRVRIKAETNAYSFNALFISLKSSQEDRIPLRMGVLNLVHELMHSFGAKHDPDPKDSSNCTPIDKWTNGRFLMSKYSNDGHKLNHEIISPCTKSMVVQNLSSPKRTSCLVVTHDSFCGDGITQGFEECDCGTTFQCIASQACCYTPDDMNITRPCKKRKLEDCPS